MKSKFSFKSWANKAGEATTAKVIGVVITIVVALSLVPTVIVFVSAGKNSTTGSSDTMLDLVPLFFCLGLAITAIMYVVHEVRE